MRVLLDSHRGDGVVNEPARYPRATIRLRYGRKMLRHGLALGWRTEYPEKFPVIVTSTPAQTPDNSQPESEEA